MMGTETLRTLAKSTLVGLLAISVVGCTTERTNIKWAYDEGIKPKIEVIPKENWMDFLETFGSKIEVIVGNKHKIGCLYVFRVGTGEHEIYLKEGIEYCLEHEFGHIREQVDGLPFHSWWARE